MSESLNLNNTHNLVKHYCYLISNNDVPNALSNIITNYLYIYKISYNEAYKILTRGSCCAGFWNENKKKYIPGILARKFKSTKKLMIRLFDNHINYIDEMLKNGNKDEEMYKIIQFPLLTNIMDCTYKYEIEQCNLDAFKVSSQECLLGYYSDDTELKYKKYPTFIKSYHYYLNQQNQKSQESIFYIENM